MTLPTTTSRLHRSPREKVLFGVCGGLAEYFDVDPSLVRIAFVVAALWGGVGLLLYLPLAVILPIEGDTPSPDTARRTERSRGLAGLILLTIGGLLLVSNLGVVPWLTWNLFWPAVVIVVGFVLLVVGSRPGAAAPQE